MIIGVTGHKGRLGSELVRRGCQPIKANVTDFSELRQAVRNVKPDVIIHTASVTNVDSCEFAPLSAARTNTGGTHTLRQVFDGKIIYTSTDFVFDGEAGPYREQDKPNPINVYGWSKLGGEIVLHDTPSLIVRTTILFDRYSTNFVTAVIKQIEAGKIVTAPDRLSGSPTYIPHLAEGILKAIDLDLSGIINISGSRVMSRFELAQAIAEQMGKGKVEKGPVTGEARRPLKAGFFVAKAQSAGIPIYDPTIGISEVVNALETMAAG